MIVLADLSAHRSMLTLRLLYTIVEFSKHININKIIKY